MDQIIDHKPIGAGLDAFRANLTSVCESRGLPFSVEAILNLSPEDRQDISLDLVLALQALPASRLLPSIGGCKNLFGDLARWSESINSDEFEFDRIVPLLVAVLDREPDAVVWDSLRCGGTTTTTAYAMLEDELGSIYTDVPGFDEAYFGTVDGLQEVAAVVFSKLKDGDDFLYYDETGWIGWPELAEEKQVLDWLIKIIDTIKRIATEMNFLAKDCRSILGWPYQPLQGSATSRQSAVGVVDSRDASSKQSEVNWSNVLIVGTLKRSPEMDTASRTWIGLGRDARDVFTAQDSRRFVLGFTLCGLIMRLWGFDRVGAVSSTPFNINDEGVRFVLSILAFLRMNTEELGYDSTIVSTSDGTRCLDIVRDGQPERLILDGLIRRPSCIAGRATTCWKARREGNKTPLVIKDSWQDPGRKHEGIHGRDDDIQGVVRRGLDLKQGRRYHQDHSTLLTFEAMADSAEAAHSPSTAGHKRTSSHLSPRWSPPKRTCQHDPGENRVHRRVIVQDYGVPIYQARSRLSLLSAIAQCIEGYHSLHLKTGLLHGDISPTNLMLNESSNPVHSHAFLIDLDLALQDQDQHQQHAPPSTPPPRAKPRGTRAFMAIGLLLDERHSYTHDLESFFWICIHHGPTGAVSTRFERWNSTSLSDRELADIKKGIVAHEPDFLVLTRRSFTPFYAPLAPWVNSLRKVVFPRGGRLEVEDVDLSGRMVSLLRDACEDRGVGAG
ncbi:hypothetical protein P170DRAFT_511741 [Aspergillus steynii IBT 23096]|uniref:non-specific serine/threonine protein kinase n=1 Tax=Aspergillus steynii IBT 23096 TaxID=1392250 RepID=A0A2I2G2I5_9EURO|nr:uncharacterized protein P170DRAFT_511741 [Aspergillus steynii IBT 23096]PLB47088.1 hypothetical protein P170DRAFT_511741 [Aspergillus steynii IBT 23096]